mmetsp:Transcript_23204/g.48170  ORF Transcript_23204/g.48170 Transcript_23204/m.48170 type:complete len:575 (+) Transcript_23204:107-1831(+)
MPPSATKRTPKKNKTMTLPRKSSLQLQEATVEKSPLGTKTFNLTIGAGDDDYNSGKSPRFQNQADSPEFSAGRRDPKAAAAEQARLVAEMLGEEVSAGDIAARYDMSDSSDDELDELMAESKAKATGEDEQDAKFTGEFDWNSQMGPMVENLQKENTTLKGDLDKKKQQVKKLGIMLNALEPIPGVDAEKLLSVLDERGEPVHSDMRDVKIIQMAKKIRNLQFEMNKQKNMNKNAEEAILQLDQELEKKQAEIDTLATPQARAAIMKTVVGGIGALESDPSFGGTTGGASSRQTKELQKQLDDMRHKFEIMKEKNRVLEHKLIQEVGGEGPAAEKLSKIMHDGWKGRAQQITLLKTKMKRLEANAKTGGMMESKGNRSTTAQQRVAANNLRRDVDFKAQQELNEMEKMRQQGVEQLSKAYEEMKERLERTEKRYTSAKVRVGCLEQDNAKMRDGMKVFVGKASNDDKLVDMLKQEAQELRKKLKRVQERETKMRGERETMRGEGKEVEMLRQQLSQYKNQNSHQERIINQLRADMHRMRNPSSSKKKSGSVGPRRIVDAVELSSENDATHNNRK